MGRPRPEEMPLTDLRPDELPIDTALVRRLVAVQFPQWAGLTVEPVAKSGWDNATYRLGEAMLVRMPRLPRWEGQVEREQTWLPRLAPQLPLAVPAVLARGVPSEAYPMPWSVYAWIDGDTARPDRLDQRQAAADLGAFLAALQRVDPAGGPAPEWSNGFRGVPLADERDSPVVAERMRAKFAELAGLVDVDAVRAVWESALAAPVWEGPPVWIHGDPAPGNLLSRDARLSAVIDFGTMAVGDPACDLIAAWTWFDSPRSRDVFRAQLDVDDATWARGRAWGLASVLPSRADLTEASRHRIEEIVADHNDH